MVGEEAHPSLGLLTKALAETGCPRPGVVSHRLSNHGISSLELLDQVTDASIRKIFHLDAAPEREACNITLSLRRQRARQTPPANIRIQEHAPSLVSELETALQRDGINFRTSYLHRLAHKGITSDTHLRNVTVTDIIDLFPEASIKGFDSGRLDEFIYSITEMKKLSNLSLEASNDSGLWHDQGRKEGLWNIQLLAKGVSLNLWQLGYVLEEIYDESRIAHLRTQYSGVDWLSRTFHTRRKGLGCAFINEPLELDRNLPPTVHETSKPRESIKSAKRARTHEPGSAADTLYRRQRDLLCAEAGTRALTLSRKGSWTQARSGMWCYASFADEFLPGQPHLPVTTENLVRYAQHFSNGGTLINYINDLKMAHDMAQQPLQWEPSVAARLTRGAKKVTFRADRPIIRRYDNKRLIALAVQEGDMVGAALYAVASHFTLRGQSEMFPIQVNGRLSDDGTQRPLERPGWHSTCNFKQVKGKLECTLTLFKRKNKDQPTDIVRKCVCSKLGRPLCGVCHLKEYCEQASTPQRRIFTTKILAATQRLRRRCVELGIPHGERMGWHAFRRGSASDLLADGEPISAILKAGGWKGPAALAYLARSELDRRLELIKEVDASDTDGEPTA